VSTDAGSARPAGPDAADPTAAALRGFGPVGILAIFIILLGDVALKPISALLALWWAKRSGTSWRELGFVRPTSWPRTIAGGIAFGVVLKFAMKAIVMPLLGADPVNHAFHDLAGNPAAIPETLYLLTIGAGFGEETIFRGYMFERFGRLIGSGPGARVAIVLLTSALFGMAHYAGQGLAGMEQATLTGLIFGTIFARTRRLAMVMVAHATFDLTAYAMIYWDLETAVAHLIIR